MKLGYLSRRQVVADSGLLVASPLYAAARRPDPWDMARAIRARVRPAMFPTRTVSIFEHGARGDRTTLNTQAITSAIGEVAEPAATACWCRQACF